MARRKVRRVKYKPRTRRRRRARKNPSDMLWLGALGLGAYLLWQKKKKDDAKKAAAPAAPPPIKEPSGAAVNIQGDVDLNLMGSLGSGGMGSLG